MQAMNLKLKKQQTGENVHLPVQIDENRLMRTVSSSDSNNNNTKSEDIEQKQLFEKCMNLFRFLGLLIGVGVTQDWKPQRHFRFFVMSSANAFLAFSILYTVYGHWMSGNYIKVLEPLAITGTSMSVMQMQE